VCVYTVQVELCIDRKRYDYKGYNKVR